MIWLDTNVLIRFFTHDIPKRAYLVKKLLESGELLVISDVVFPEVEYVLSTSYNNSRTQLANAFSYLASHSSITCTNQAKIAIRLYKNSNLDMADCLIAAHAQNERLASFDKTLLKTPGIKPYWSKADSA